MFWGARAAATPLGRATALTARVAPLAELTPSTRDGYVQLCPLASHAGLAFGGARRRFGAATSPVLGDIPPASVPAAASSLAVPDHSSGPKVTPAAPLLTARRQKSMLQGYFGVEFFGGRRPTEDNIRMVELPKPNYDPRPYTMEFSRYPGIASGLGAEWFYREGQKKPLTYYHMRSKATGDMVAVGSTDARLRESRVIDSYIKERTRGYAIQILLEGRGVKAYWEPKFPNLKVRLGVGAKVKDLTEYCLRDPDVRIHCNKKGDVVVVHGPNKPRVGTLAYRLLRVLQPRLQVYTGKGAHFAFYPVPRKVVRKK